LIQGLINDVKELQGTASSVIDELVNVSIPTFTGAWGTFINASHTTNIDASAASRVIVAFRGVNPANDALVVTIRDVRVVSGKVVIDYRYGGNISQNAAIGTITFRVVSY
jgi:hypothetical protein